MWLKLLILGALLAVAFIPDTEPLFGFDIKLVSYEAVLPKGFSGGLLANRWLSQADHLFAGEIRGPESFAIWKGKVYTGLGDGHIVELQKHHYRTVAFLDPEQQGLENCTARPHLLAQRCVRPLGLRFDSHGRLYAVDPYHGVFRIDVTSGQYELVMDITKHKLPDGSATRFLDDLVVVDKDNGHVVIYMSDASQRWLLHDVFYMVGEFDSTGRLVSFDTETQQLRVELDNLAFPNGLELADNKSSILMAILSRRQIVSYHINGKNKGKMELLTDTLPGDPDNIKRSADPTRETFWIGLFSGRNQHRPNLALDVFSKLPLARRFAFRLTRAIGFLIQSFGEVIGCDHVASFGYHFKLSHFLQGMVADYGLAVEIDAHGNIINSMHSPDGYTRALSEVYEYKQTQTARHFYLGSVSNKYVGHLVVPKDGLQEWNPKLAGGERPPVLEPTESSDKTGTTHRTIDSGKSRDNQQGQTPPPPPPPVASANKATTSKSAGRENSGSSKAGTTTTSSRVGSKKERHQEL